MKTYEWIHFIGIGGISMSGLAEIMLKKGVKVTGSDMTFSPLIEKLLSHGAIIHMGHQPSNIENPELVVYTAAVKDSNSEIVTAKQKNIPLMDRAEFLGLLMADYTYPIAISGTHGKTTTTALMSSVLLKADTDPTILIGASFDLINGNLRVGQDDILLTEACEYKRSFTHFKPKIGIVLNIDLDHLDYYKNIDDIKSAFYDFSQNISSDGYLIYNNNCTHSYNLFKNLNCQLISFGLNPESDVSALNIKYNPYPEFDLYVKGTLAGRVKLRVPGEHNVYNALSVAAASHVMGIKNPVIIQGLEDFTGTHRRFEFKGTLNDAPVVDDYAHHPTEIKATLKTIRPMCKKTLHCVFQPHTFSRTHLLLKEFATSFYEADKVYVVDIYAAREIDEKKIHSRDLVLELCHNGIDAIYCDSFTTVIDILKSQVNHSDFVVTMGAGNIDVVSEAISSNDVIG